MDIRPSWSTQKPSPVQRTVSSSHTFHRDWKRTFPLSGLSNVRSVSQPVSLLDLPPNFDDNPLISPSESLLNNSSQIYGSPEAVSPEDGESERPVKRQKLEDDDVSEVNGESEESIGKGETIDSAYSIVPGAALPNPPIPNNLSGLAAHHKNESQRTGNEAKRKPNGIRPPSIAVTIPPPQNAADFYPWTGRHHPEDVMSQAVIKAGFSDTPPGSLAAESNAARPIIWPNLSQKNNMGLQTLSYLYTSVMDRRQALGKCTAPSTFKPPPRVTVTDTKREAWLRDLASPDVPLRKQSRTIPHGIRGKLLMEQCLTKNVPIPRAIWLAKCVGANELRAFRRKGISGAAAASGEQKWIREWTVHVEQFLDSIIASCGQPDWQTKMDYAIKLANGFYSEQLLEKDHFLDWIVASLTDAPSDKLPIWLIVVQIYWKDTTTFAKRGRKLATAILEHTQRLMQLKVKSNGDLQHRLQKLLARLAVSNRGYLVLPTQWTKYRHFLTPRMLSQHPNSTVDAAAQNISHRNERITKPLTKTARNTHSPLLHLYSMLDAVSLQLDLVDIVRDCLKLVPVLSDLIAALLDWSASVFRTGRSRIYLASRLIAQLRDDGHDTDGAVLEYFRYRRKSTVDIHNIHLVITDLVRADRFSPARYLQWLITSGTLSSDADNALATGLLSVIPSDALSPHLHNTRQMLARRLGRDLDDLQIIEHVKAQIDSALRNCDSNIGDLSPELSTASSSVKLAISYWIRAKTATLAKQSGLDLETFCVLRKVVECTEDFHVLVELLDQVLSTDNALLLATVTDTVNLYAQVFAALGHLQPIVDTIMAQYRLLRSQQPLDRTLIVALTALIAHFPRQLSFMKLLDNDLTICEQQSSMAVCSPASDNLVSMQVSRLDSDDDIDSVFASGNVMDEQLMQRVFARIVQRAGKPGSVESTAPSKVCSWLTQLHTVDAGSFSHMAHDYIHTSLLNPNDGLASSRATIALLASSCVAFDAIVDFAKEANSPRAASAAIDILLSNPRQTFGLHDVDLFRFAAQQEQYLSSHEHQVMPLVCMCLDDPEFAVSEQRIIDLLLRYSVGNPSTGLETVVQSAKSVAATEGCRQLCTRVLRLEGMDEAALNPRSIISLASPLSIGHCAAALEFCSSHHQSDGVNSDADLRDAILQAITNDSQVWPQLLETTHSETIRGIFEWARDELISSAAAMLSDQDLPNQGDIDRQLEILDIAHHAANETEGMQITASITENLKSLETHLSAAAITADVSRHVAAQAVRSLHILLHFAALFAIQPRRDESEAWSQTQAQLLAALCSLVVHPHLQRQPSLLEYMLDIAAAIADTLPEAALSSLAARPSLCAAIKDPRVVALLGWNAGPGAPDVSAYSSSLALVTPHPAPPSASQQRPFTKHPGQSFAAAAAARAAPQPPQQGQKVALRPSADAAAKVTRFVLRPWEILSDATPSVGENDTCLSLTLFGARRA